MNEQEPHTFEEIAAILESRKSPLRLRRVRKAVGPVEPAPCDVCGQMSTELLVPAHGITALCPACFLKAARES